MLVLSRGKNEGITLSLPDGRRIRVVAVDFRSHGTKVRLGVEAPSDIAVHRDEVQAVIDSEELSRKSATPTTHSRTG